MQVWNAESISSPFHRILYLFILIWFVYHLLQGFQGWLPFWFTYWFFSSLSVYTWQTGTFWFYSITSIFSIIYRCFLLHIPLHSVSNLRAVEVLTQVLMPPCFQHHCYFFQTQFSSLLHYIHLQASPLAEVDWKWVCQRIQNHYCSHYYYHYRFSWALASHHSLKLPTLGQFQLLIVKYPLLNNCSFHRHTFKVFVKPLRDCSVVILPFIIVVDTLTLFHVQQIENALFFNTVVLDIHSNCLEPSLQLLSSSSNLFPYSADSSCFPVHSLRIGSLFVIEWWFFQSYYLTQLDLTVSANTYPQLHLLWFLGLYSPIFKFSSNILICLAFTSCAMMVVVSMLMTMMVDYRCQRILAFLHNFILVRMGMGSRWRMMMSMMMLTFWHGSSEK